MNSVKSRDSSKYVKFQKGLSKNSENSNEDESRSILNATMLTTEANGSITTILAAPAPLVKPSQLGLRYITKPASIQTVVTASSNGSTTTTEKLNYMRNISMDDYEQQYLRSVVEMNNEEKFKNINLENIVWPQLRKKMQKKSLSSKHNNNNINNNSNSNYNQINMNTSSSIDYNLNSLSSGAEYYDAAEIKVTVL
jgi:hypothetical protein